MKMIAHPFHPRRRAPMMAILLLCLTSFLLFSACKGSGTSPDVTEAPTEAVTVAPGDDTTAPTTPPADTASEPADPSDTTAPEDTTPADTLPPEETETTPETEAGPTMHTYSDLLDNIIITAFHPISYPALVNQEQFDLAAAAGIDVMEYCGGMRVTDQRTMKKALEYAAQAGILCNVYDDRIQNNAIAMDRDQLFSIWDEYKGREGVGGYYVLDEAVNPNDFAALINAVAAYDPHATPFINNFPDIWGDGYYADRLADLAHLIYVNRQNFVLSFDNYPFGAAPGSVDERTLFKHFEAIRVAGNETGVRTGFYAQVISYGYRKLNGSETLYHVNVALAYGCTEINYFAWGTPNDELCPGFGDAVIDREGKPTDLYYDIININKYAHTIGPTLVKLKAVEIYHTGKQSDNSGMLYPFLKDDYFVQTDGYTILSRMEDKTTGRNYLMVVNKAMNREQEITLHFAGVDSLAEIDQTTGQEVVLSDYNVADGTLTRTLPAGGAILLALPEGKAFGTPAPASATGNLLDSSIILASDSEGRDGWFVNRLTDGVTISETTRGGWRAQRNDGREWLIFDMGQAQTFDRLDLYPARNGQQSGVYFPAGIVVSVSDDGDNWREIFRDDAIPQPTTEVPVFRFDTVTARYLRLDFTICPAGICELCEVMLFHDDGSIPAPGKTSWCEEELDPTVSLTLGKPVVDYSSNYEHPEWNNSIHHLTDGKYNTNWASDVLTTNTKDTVEYITVDLQKVYTLGRVVLHPMYDARSNDYTLTSFPGKITVSLSTDGVNFTDVAVFHDKMIKAQPLTIHFDPAEGRYLKITCTDLVIAAGAGSCYIVQFSQVEAFAYMEPVEEARGYLKAVIREAEALDASFYTDDSMAVLHTALSNAKAILNNTNATAQALEEAVTQVTAATNGLVRRSFGENLALGKPVTATSDYVAPEGIFKAAYLTDGENPDHMTVYDTHNGWSVNPYEAIQRDTPVDITIDLTAVYTVTTILIQPAYYDPCYFPDSYQLQTSVDGQSWQTVASVQDVTGLSVGDQLLYSVDNVKARYVRIHITRHSALTSGTAYISQMGEIEVYGA